MREVKASSGYSLLHDVLPYNIKTNSSLNLKKTHNFILKNTKKIWLMMMLWLSFFCALIKQIKLWIEVKWNAIQYIILQGYKNVIQKTFRRLFIFCLKIFFLFQYLLFLNLIIPYELYIEWRKLIVIKPLVDSYNTYKTHYLLNNQKKLIVCSYIVTFF